MQTSHTVGRLGDTRVKVFISSVTHLLKEERNALPDYLRVVGHEPLRFEDFRAKDRSSREACLAGVDVADVYVLLLGPKYGDPLPDTGRAPTAEEFIRARQRGIPILVFNKQIDEPDEPAQGAFKQEVGHYVNGRLWRSFTDPLSCNLAVLQALNDIQVDSGPMERRPLRDGVDVPWLATVTATGEHGYPVVGGWASGGRGGGLVPGSVYSPILEVHVVPVGSTSQPSERQLAELAKSMARTARELGFVSEGDQLVVGAGDGFAWALRPPGTSSRAGFGGTTVEEFRGLIADRAGAVGAFMALRADNLGTLIDRPTLQADLAHLYTLASRHEQAAKWVTVAAGLTNAERIFEGDPSQMGSRNRGSMRMTTGASVRRGGDFMVDRARLSYGFGDIGADLAHELLADLSRLR